ncbi:hypothetical protein F5B21DRAFT_516334 [Xylaria acuta]|nr:hypothetical protein F5B21DRAFT_516334 [Xylaria acuta]
MVPSRHMPPRPAYHEGRACFVPRVDKAARPIRNNNRRRISKRFREPSSESESQKYQQLTNKIPQAIAAIASRHRMTLRSSGTHVSMNNRDNGVYDTKETTQLSCADGSSLPAFSTTGPVVCASSKMPPGYRFVPKGDPYVTRNCRQRTRQAHQVTYAVVNDEKKQVGIRVPLPIYTAVLESASATRDHRRLIVKKRDEDLEKRFREAILAQFPRIPPEEIRIIVRRATVKGEGRVGRTGRKGMGEKAFLAAQAHIRHTKTDYEDLLRSGTNREAARIRTARNVFSVLNEWGPVTTRRKQNPPNNQHELGTRIGL